MFKLENIQKSPLTSALGLLIIIASVGSVFVSALDIDWTEAGIGVALGAAFLFAKDKSGNTAAMVIFLTLGTWLSSCVTYQKCADKFGTEQDTVTITKEVTIVLRDTIKVPADTIGTYIDLSQMQHDTVLVENEQTGLQLKYWRDEANRLLVQCLQKAKVVITEKEVIKEVQIDCPPVTQFAPKPTPWYSKFWFWMLLGVVLWLVVITLFKALLKAIFK